MKKLLMLSLFLSIFVVAGCNKKTLIEVPQVQKNNIDHVQEQSSTANSQNQGLINKNSESEINSQTKNTGTNKEITATETSTSSGKWVNTPADIKSISLKDNITYLSIDILSLNPDFLPGKTQFFINQSTKLREVSINSNTKSYLCGAGADNNYTTADISTSTTGLLDGIQNKLLNKEYTTYYFDITDANVQAIYEQCLP